MGWDWPKKDNPPGRVSKPKTHRRPNDGRIEPSCEQAAVAMAGTVLLVVLAGIGFIAKGISK